MSPMLYSDYEFSCLTQCEIRFHDVIDRTVHIFTSTYKIPKHKCFEPLLFNLISLTQLCDKEILTFVDF